MLVWTSSVALTVFVRPNYEQLTTGEQLYYVSFNTAVGYAIGLILERWAKDRYPRYLFSALALLLAGVLVHEAVVEALVLRSGPVNVEGLYFTLIDQSLIAAIFIVLRAVGSWRRLAAASQAVRLMFDPASFLVRVSGGSRRIRAADVLYIKAERDFTRVVCADTEYFVSENMKTLLEKAHRFGVVRIHKSFAVNMNRVDRMGRTEVELGGHRLPVGRTFARHSGLLWQAMASAGDAEPSKSPGGESVR